MFDELHSMLTGPGRLRFILQPLMAVLLGLRDAKLDVAAGRAPFVFSLLKLTDRKTLAKAALRQIAVPLAVAFALDALFQYVLFQRVHLWHAVVIGAVLIALPYSCARGLFNRWLREHRPRHA